MVIRCDLCFCPGLRPATKLNHRRIITTLKSKAAFARYALHRGRVMTNPINVDIGTENLRVIHPISKDVLV
ncbi:hypothetical protein RIF29_16382 [Crotalaria pallida]|uniref:Uncharacterized protein n=1 Tax=Crotalaria pallida TaxID=3830 RepID=A0AAN9FH66_CROPI